LFHLKEKSINKQLKKLRQKRQNHRIVVAPVKNIAILNNPQSGLSFENLKYVQKTLGFSSSQFDIFTFKHKNDHYNELRGIVASKDIFSSFGKIKSPEISSFLDKKYDLLLDFTGLTNIYEKYLSFSIQANCRVGYLDPEESYDIMLNIKKGDIKNFANETVRYLQIIGLIG
jgi:hypothetical protein